MPKGEQILEVRLEHPWFLPTPKLVWELPLELERELPANSPQSLPVQMHQPVERARLYELRPTGHLDRFELAVGTSEVAGLPADANRLQLAPRRV